jgi:hypothetical protein
MRHHTSTTPKRARLVRSIRTGQAHHYDALEAVQVADDTRLSTQPVRDAPIKPPGYRESTQPLADPDHRSFDAITAPITSSVKNARDAVHRRVGS